MANPANEAEAKELREALMKVCPPPKRTSCSLRDGAPDEMVCRFRVFCVVCSVLCVVFVCLRVCVLCSVLHVCVVCYVLYCVLYCVLGVCACVRVACCVLWWAGEIGAPGGERVEREARRRKERLAGRGRRAPRKGPLTRLTRLM